MDIDKPVSAPLLIRLSEDYGVSLNVYKNNKIKNSWIPVKNGGILTHTDSDFRRAQFFFCNGMGDPWLNELLSRSLIVRHASWVTLCVAEEFRMPVAAYTLDDGFDQSKIRILDPSPPSQKNNSSIIDQDHMSSGMGPQPVVVVANSRKRRVDYEDDSQRLKKKARIDVQYPNADNYKVRQICVTAPPSEEPAKPGIPNAEETVKSTSKWISFVARNSIRRPKASKARKAFESCIIYPKAVSPLPTPKKPKKTSYPPLSPHTLFWNDLFARCYARDRISPLTLSVDDLLHAPRTKAVIFDVNKTHLGRNFINMDYAHTTME